MTITLATLADASAQEVFDQVVTHLLTQNARSVGDEDFLVLSYELKYQNE